MKVHGNQLLRLVVLREEQLTVHEPPTLLLLEMSGTKLTFRYVILWRSVRP